MRDAARDFVGGPKYRRSIFEAIYRENLWGDSESRSGSGSSLIATIVVRDELPQLFRDFGVRSVLDTPCGDFAWMNQIVGDLERYLGIDIVPELIETNNKWYGNETIQFVCGDIASASLPCVDLAICRDCLIHLPTRLILAALQNFRASGTRLLMLTNSPGSEYYDIPIGSFRPIDFTRPPFNFPTPEREINEDPAGHRRLSLWQMKSLPALR